MTVTLANRFNLLGEKFIHLLWSTPDKLPVVQHGAEIYTRQQGIPLQTIQKIVFVRAGLQGGCDGVAVPADGLVDLLAVAAVSDRRHQDVLRRHVRKNG